MTDSISPAEETVPAVSRNRGESHRLDLFKAKESRKALIYQQMETERVVSDAKIAKLRALRLAKEESDRDAAARTAEETKTAARPKKSKRAIAGEAKS